MQEIKPKKITSENIRPFGSLVAIPDYPAPKQGHNWDCWNQLAVLGEGKFTIGVVQTRPNSGPIKCMERHLKKEIIIPVLQPVIQPMALPGRVDIDNAKPLVTDVEAFIIFPGEAVLIGHGVWHCAAMPLRDDETIYFYLTEPNNSDLRYGGWIEFNNNNSINIQKGDN